MIEFLRRILWRARATTPDVIGTPFALRAPPPGADEIAEPGPDVLDAAELAIQERTRARMEALRLSQAESEVVLEGEGPPGDGLSVDWSVAQSDDWENLLKSQKLAWLRRGAHHMGSPLTPLLPSPQEMRLAGCERLMRLTRCDRLAPLVVNGTLEPQVSAGRLAFRVAGHVVSVRTDEEVAAGETRFSGEGVEFSDTAAFESWVVSL